MYKRQGYSAYPLAAQQFFREFGDKFKFDITQVIGLTNDDEVSKEFRPFKQMIERLKDVYKRQVPGKWTGWLGVLERLLL